ncbi:hypothetical protein F2Q69_00044180 [Brassica cretica]|uniref:Uncharacterized protein n=1 Tax=Brassica cretica TaxID=69181 RepID=A0A8S9NF03_BRACR|nr:hypothetical protein F2Q69_00044180 [Brassica cretica]
MSSSQGDKRSSDVEMGEATSKAPVSASSIEAPSSSALAVAPTHGFEIQVPLDVGNQVETSVLCVPDASAQPTGSSTTPILLEDKEKAAESMPPPPARKEIILALRAPIAAPVVQPKGRKRWCTTGNDGESSQQRGLNLATGLRGKFVSLIDGMISECGSEASHLARDLTEMQGKWSESEAMLKAIEGSHSAKVSKLEAEIGELERDIGMMASSLLEEKKARKAKSSEVRRLQHQIDSDEGSTSRAVQEAKDTLRVEFKAHLAKISDFLGSLECIRSRDFALANVEGGMAVVRALQSETPPSLQAEETRLFDRKGDLAVVDGDFDLVQKTQCGKIPWSRKSEAMRPRAWTRRWVKRRFRFQKMITLTISLERFFLCL